MRKWKARAMDLATNWDDLRLLLAVTKRGSLFGAAQELDIAVSTVSRRMTKFERNLGSPLLERRVDGCSLTDFGERMASLAKNFAADLDRERTDNQSKPGALSGTVRIVHAP